KNRVIQINHRLKKLKDNARELLLSEEGIKHRRKRPVEVEQTFGNLKQNKNFRRFSLRGLKKVEIEFGLLAIAHNISKYCNKINPKMAI
ncbi:MAG: transposase, partial [Bacteroidales bacterium]